MALPATNTTCDIYRNGNGPPATPDVAGVRCLLLPKGRSTLTTDRFTHVMYVPPTTDIRDKTATLPIDLNINTTECDWVWIPDRNGVKYGVVLVRRTARGTALDAKEVLLRRQAVTWPSDNL